MFGLVWIKKTNLKIRDIIADHVQIQKAKRIPIIVSNHVSWLDVFVYMSSEFSAISKNTMAQVPILGRIAIARQVIFCDRGSKDDRDRTLESLKNRIDRVREYGDIPPVMVFAEGTVTNGRTLMSFKKGAFQTGDLIKIMMLNYNYDYGQVLNSTINIDPLLAIIIQLSQLANKLEIIEFEDAFDPQWVYTKHNISASDENAWEYVAKEVKSIMLFASGFHSTEDSFREVLTYESNCQVYNKELSSK